QRRPARAVAAQPGHGRVRHALGVRIGVPVAAHRGHDPAAGPRRLAALDRCPISSQRGVPDLDGICRLLPPGVDPTGRGHRHRMSVKLAAPVLLGVLMLALWEGAVRAAAIPPYILPGPLLIIETLVADWSTLLPSLWVTLKITLEALAAAVIIGRELAVLFSLSALLPPS